MSPLQVFFVFTFVKKKKIATIISTLQMAQTPSCLKNKVEIVFDVSCVNLAPHLAIMFLVHSLHLTKMTVKTNNEGEFKQNITIKCDHNATNILNVKFIIVQIFQFRASVRDKQHSHETVYYKTTINTYGLPIEGISLREYLESAKIEVE
jgi:hypothetical protein